ncbi:MAG: AAA family ATPase [Clostridia bacterium]|nr:AAA family ATPase [Clostridia bacterium]
MGTGIQICGLNGCGKSTLGKALAERMGFHFIDNEHLYFSRAHADEPYANPRSRAEVERLLMEEVRRHPDFVFSAVKGDYGEEIIPLYSYVVVMEVPKDIRSQRVRNRSFQKFGSRMLAGGDLHSQEEAFFQLTESRRDDDIERWLQKVNCPVIRVDGTKPIEDNVDSILRAIGGYHASGSQAR